jgi:hypothetical protein
MSARHPYDAGATSECCITSVLRAANAVLLKNTLIDSSPPTKSVTIKIPAQRSATLFYDWNGRPTHYGSYVINVLKRWQRLRNDPRCTNAKLRYRDEMYDPDMVSVS